MKFLRFILIFLLYIPICSFINNQPDFIGTIHCSIESISPFNDIVYQDKLFYLFKNYFIEKDTTIKLVWKPLNVNDNKLNHTELESRKGVFTGYSITDLRSCQYRKISTDLSKLNVIDSGKIQDSRKKEGYNFKSLFDEEFPGLYRLAKLTKDTLISGRSIQIYEILSPNVAINNNKISSIRIFVDPKLDDFPIHPFSRNMDQECHGLAYREEQFFSGNVKVVYNFDFKPGISKEDMEIVHKLSTVFK